MKHLLKQILKKEFPEILYSLLDLSHVDFSKTTYKTLSQCANVTLILNDDRTQSMHEDSDYLLKSWHKEHMFSHKSHYSFFSRRQTLNNICQMQKDPLYPVLHFPTIKSEQLTMGKSAKIELQCRLICKSDFIYNLMTWNSFHLARYFFKPVMPLVTKELNSQEMLFLNSTKSIKNALRFTQLSALSVALLVLPEEFTFAALLKVILGLSNYGIPSSMVYQESVINQQLKLNCLELSAIYLPLLNSLTVHDKRNPDASLNLEKPKIQYSQVSQSLQAHLDSHKNQFSDMFLTQLQEATCTLTEHKMLSIFQSSNSYMASTFEDTNVKETKELCDSLLSPSFILKNSMTEESRNELFEKLPNALRTEAINKAGTLRLLNLLSPKAFISKQSISKFWLAKPKPYHIVPLKHSLVYLNKRADWFVRRRRFLNEGFKFPRIDLKNILELVSSAWQQSKQPTS